MAEPRPKPRPEAAAEALPKRRPCKIGHPVGPPPEHLLKGKGTEEGKDTDKGKGTDKGKDMPESLRRKGKGTDKGMGKRRFFWSGNDD